MKKMKLLLPALAVAFAVPAFAQNSVTLYGVIDEGIDYTNNAGGHAAYDLQSGYVQGSRWGLKGTEDLGGGLKAVFQLENGFNLSNGNLGQGQRMFGRQAYVGLSSDKFGTVTLGRQYDSLVDYLAQTTANGNWAGYLFSHPYDNDNTDNSFRVDNTVKYASPTYAGLQFGGTYSFSNATNFAANRQYSFGGQYANGGLLVAAAYLQANNPGAGTGGAISSTGDSNFPAALLRIFGAGVNYTFGPATLGFSYTNSYMKQPTGTEYLGGTILPAVGALSNLRFQNFELNGKYQISPALFLGAMYDYTRANFNATTGKLSPVYHTVGLMADYNLSKRTDVYVQGAYQHVAGDKTGTALDNANVLGANNTSSNGNQLVARVAIRHKF
ncbi:porin [Trinickia dinghuensis]|uniref:Porin n=1 Tax=Trinickia dinghuensis TaxID=2291023 RepID=A0A3D8K5Y4_9BURK|nr:porin [Trinickia dinghuensis]RDV00287.1 porin [Trinickia dinghuensis]